MKIGENTQMEIGLVPTSMAWMKVQTSEGEFTLLIVSTPVGTWAFFMPRKMVLDLEQGMHKMASSIEVAREIPNIEMNDGRPS